jgi:CDP-diacylglycerol--serine O-phosphatidyltransferase
MTNTQSAFGEQYDSLADVISFGAAPALVMYSWALKGMGNWGWLAAFIYVAGAALRLARFNTNIHVVDKRFFQGLPSPAAAALVAGLVWIATDLREARWINATGADLSWLAWVVTVYAGLTMVSNSPFYSFKDFNLKRSVPFIFLILLVLVFVLVSSDPPLVLFSLFVVYGLSGHALLLWRWSRGTTSFSKPPTRADGGGCSRNRSRHAWRGARRGLARIVHERRPRQRPHADTRLTRLTLGSAKGYNQKLPFPPSESMSASSIPFVIAPVPRKFAGMRAVAGAWAASVRPASVRPASVRPASARHGSTSEGYWVHGCRV